MAKLLLLSFALITLIGWSSSAKRRARVLKEPTTIDRMQISPNMEVVREPFHQFIEKTPIIPPFQRELDEDRLKQFYEIIVEHNEKQLRDDPVPCLHALSIGEYDGQFHIIDGQHRFRALEQFYNDHNGSVQFNIVYFLRRILNQSALLGYFMYRLFAYCYAPVLDFLMPCLLLMWLILYILLLCLLYAP